ncbi:hypothetical protein AAIB41_00130 [Brucella sp. BE17]|uniref:hypothetical protein n=1 Tax=Brucella sp. BE17 TaxID=3142977 RepID=UPI0031BB3D99
MSEDRYPSLDTLLDLDGQVLVVDPEGGRWVKFVVTRVPVSPEKPHGLDYSLTLHASRFTLHASRFTLHASRFTLHASRFTLHASRFTLHGPSGDRLVGFDNSHPVGRGRRGEPMDHRHRLQTMKPYAWEDATTLLADFWKAVDAVLKERGVL